MKARSTLGERAGRALALLVALLTTTGPASPADEASVMRPLSPEKSSTLKHGSPVRATIA